MNMELITRFESSLAARVSNSSRFWSHPLRQLNEVKLLSQDSSLCDRAVATDFIPHLLPSSPHASALWGTSGPRHTLHCKPLVFPYALPIAEMFPQLPSLFNSYSSSQSQIKSQMHPLGWLL